MMILKRTPLSSKSTWVDFLIITILLFMSGTPVTMGDQRIEIFLVLVSFLFLIILSARREFVPTPRFLIVISIFSGILVIQGITFDFWPFHTMLGYLLRLFIGYAAFHLVKEFPKKYVYVIFYMCLCSLFFHPLAIIHETTGIDLIAYFTPINELVNPNRGFNIVVHNFHSYNNFPEEYSHFHSLRNSSCFWEPAVFAAYILLAIAFLGLEKDTFDKRRYKRILIILIITLLTTMSTTGYALLPLSLAFHFRKTYLTTRYVSKALGIALFLVLFCVVAFKLDFVGQKIRDQYYRVVYREQGWESTRFGSLVYNLEYIKKRPFFGFGIHHKTRFLLSSGVAPRVMVNSLADFAARFGLFGLITTLACIFVGVFRITKGDWKRCTLFILLVMMVLFAWNLLIHSLFLGLMFLGSASEHRHTMACSIRTDPVFTRVWPRQHLERSY